MKRLITLFAVAGAITLTACDDPRPAEPEVMEPPMEEIVAPSAEEVQVPAAAPSAVDTPPVDNSTQPTQKRSSEESVRPDSETLFY